MKKYLILLVVVVMSCSLAVPNTEEGAKWEFEVVVSVSDSIVNSFESVEDAYVYFSLYISNVNDLFKSENGFEGKIEFYISDFRTYQDDNWEDESNSFHKPGTLLLVFQNLEPSVNAGGPENHSAIIFYDLDFGAWNTIHSLDYQATVAHELSHILGAIDLYPSNVDGVNNPITNESYSAEESIMNYYNTSNLQWDDCNLEIINYYNGNLPEAGSDLELLPYSFMFKVIDSSGNPIEGVEISQYMVDFGYWGTWIATVASNPVSTGYSNEDGIYEYNENYYIVDDPVWGRGVKYSNMLVTFDDGIEVNSIWIPLHETCASYLAGNEVFLTTVVFE